MQLGLGTAALGRPQYINVKQETEKPQSLEEFRLQGLQVLEDAYILGIRYYDTAPGYGMAEQLLLEWLDTKNDSNIKIGTKWGYTYVANFNPHAKTHEIKEHSLKKLNEQWQVSQAFLPYLKIYQIHSATMETGVLKNEAVLNRLLYLKTEHGIKIGITTTGENQTEIIRKALEVSVNGKPLFDVFQVTYNMLDQSLKLISETLKTQNKTLIIKEALANGRLFRNKNYKHYDKLYDTLEQLASKYQVGVDVIALRFCGQTFPESTILSGASHTLHLKSNLESKNLQLTENEMDHLNTFKIENADYWNERKQLPWQ